MCPGIRACIVGLALQTGLAFFSPGASANSCNSPDDARSPQKLAFLVGINDYQHMDGLKGAVNDVDNMRRLLVDSYCFPDDEEHIRILTNREATREQILKGLDEHLIGTLNIDPENSKDAIVVFHYSGHGSYLPDQKGDETDGRDETIVPHDSGHEDPHENRDITDDELNTRLRQLTAITPYVTVILDSCHSGTALRGSGLARTASPDLRSASIRTSQDSPTADGGDGLRLRDSRYALVSGAGAGELSYELWMGGRAHGALTYHFADQVRKAGSDATYRDVMDKVKILVTAKHKTQHPVLEGPGADQFVFNTRSGAVEPYILIDPSLGSSGILKAGQVHGVTKDSIYAVFEPGANRFDDLSESVARVKVTRVSVTTSTVRMIAGRAYARASRAVEIEHHYPDEFLSVHFKGIEQSETLRKVAAETAGLGHIRHLDAPEGYDLLLREEDGSIVTEGGDPGEISPRVAVSDRDAVGHVVEQIKHWARWFNILKIENPATGAQSGGIEFEILRLAGGAGPAAIPGEQGAYFSVFEDEPLQFRVENKSGINLYLSILYLSADGSVGLVYPQQGEEDSVAPGKVWVSDTRDKLAAFLPEGMDQVRDVIKVIATTTSTDFSFLNMEAVRGGAAAQAGDARSRNPLEQLLANAATGQTRSGTVVEARDWVTVDRVMHVRKRMN
jgi:hypothetical protein